MGFGRKRQEGMLFAAQEQALRTNNQRKDRQTNSFSQMYIVWDKGRDHCASS